MYVVVALSFVVLLAGLFLGFFAMMITYVAYVFGVSLMIWMLVDAAKTDKYWWIALMVALPVVGSLVYFFVEKEHDYAKVPVLGRRK